MAPQLGDLPEDVRRFLVPAKKSDVTSSMAWKKGSLERVQVVTGGSTGLQVAKTDRLRGAVQ